MGRMVKPTLSMMLRALFRTDNSASFSWVKQVDLETALEQQERLSELVDSRKLVVKTAALEEAIDEWSSAELRRAQSSHSATILASEGGLSLSRSTPMPLS